MIRVFFVFEDPLDDSGVNLSFVDVDTFDPERALERVEEAAASGALWRNLYPNEQEPPFRVIPGKIMTCNLSGEHPSSATVL